VILRRVRSVHGAARRKVAGLLITAEAVVAEYVEADGAAESMAAAS
jgi:hypothetical protein